MKTAFLTMIAALTAGTITAAEFKIPFEKNTDILNEKGEKCAEGFVKGKLKFVPGANGSGLELRRRDSALSPLQMEMGQRRNRQRKRYLQTRLRQLQNHRRLRLQPRLRLADGTAETARNDPLLSAGCHEPLSESPCGDQTCRQHSGTDEQSAHPRRSSPHRVRRKRLRSKILDRMGVEYTRVSPNDAIRLNAAQAIILDADGKDALHLISGRKPVILLPDFPLETLSGVTLRNTVQDIFRASAPKDDPLFEGIPDAALYFRNASKLPVLTAKPQWTAATEPALFAKVKINARPYIIFNIAPGMVEGFWNGEKISRVWSTIFNNLNIGLSRGILLFGGERMRHNTIIPHLGEAVPENVKLKLEFRNEGKPGQTGGFKPVLLGKSWEEQGFTQKNPFYTLPKETPKQYRNNPYDGYAWYRMEVFIPESWKGATLTLDGGPIDDFDWTWFNGKAIGETTLRNSKAP